MATIREYFDSDPHVITPHVITVHRDWQFATIDGRQIGDVRVKIAYAFVANAKYWYVFISAQLDSHAVVEALLEKPEFLACTLGPDGDGIEAQMSHSDYSERESSSTLMFTKKDSTVC